MFGIKGVWNYFETGHGKGPCDGIGGSAKRQASDAVKQGKVSIQDAAEFFEWASTHEKKIKYVFYSQEEYDAADALIKERNAGRISGTMKLHAVVPADSYSVYTRNVSCYCQQCLDGSLCNTWNKHQLVTNEHEANVEIPDEPMPTVMPAELDMEMEVVSEETDFDVPEIGEFVAAMYNEKWYIGKVMGLDDSDGEVHVSFMTEVVSKTGITYKWPNPSDDLWVSRESIICKIPDPSAVGRSKRAYVLDDMALKLIDNKLKHK